MYEAYFGFRERPFDLTANPRFLVLTTGHREALSNLEYAIASRKGLAVLTGEAGSGKTTLLRAAIQRRPERVHCVHITNPALKRDEFVEMLSAHFGLTDGARSSKARLILELEGLLTRRRAEGETTVLIIDEAQSLPLDLLEEIRLLANVETAEEKLLTVVIAGQPELAERLNDPSLRQLKQRVALRCELRAFTLHETAAYIAGRIRTAGGVGAQAFTRDAVTLIHERSNGIPRVINVIADNALLTAFALGAKHVTRQLVDEVCRDFDFTASPATVPEPELSVVETGGAVAEREAAAIPITPATEPTTVSVGGGGETEPLVASLGKRRRFSFFSHDEESR